ncbi:MAG: ligase, partial [Acidimicrobiales bacterium]|nr:ligase [Acidimicrobiales bacterium]
MSTGAEQASASADEIAALDELPNEGTWELGGRTLSLTNLDKVMFPAKGPHPELTKRDVVRHYASVASSILPYLQGRPVNLQRFPNGIAQPGFYQKAAPKNTPDWITRWHNSMARPGRTESYLVLDSAAALVWVANSGVIEIHPWTSTAEHPLEPTWAMIDIDPGTKTTPDEVLHLARLHRWALDRLGVRAMPKVSGKRGIQIWVPVADGSTYDQTVAWVEAVSKVVAGAAPDLVSWEWEVAKRGGRSRLDFTQNGVGKTLVAPFSIRP